MGEEMFSLTRIIQLPTSGLSECVALNSVVADVLSSDWAQIATFVERIARLNSCWEVETNHVGSVSAIVGHDSAVKLLNFCRILLEQSADCNLSILSSGLPGPL